MNSRREPAAGISRARLRHMLRILNFGRAVNRLARLYVIGTAISNPIRNVLPVFLPGWKRVELLLVRWRQRHFDDHYSRAMRPSVCYQLDNGPAQSARSVDREAAFLFEFRRRTCLEPREVRRAAELIRCDRGHPDLPHRAPQLLDLG